MIKVLIVDDHSFVRATLASVLAQAEGVEVVGECADGSEVSAMVAAVSPDVVLMDVHMPVLDGISSTSSLRLQRPSVRVLILTAAIKRTTIEDAADAGAVGCMLKGRDPHLLVKAIRTVAAGGTVWPDQKLVSVGAG
ncbi:MAG TPA: response regulator transcription factor [Propionibacteriaceae bacterium]|nr:response regulator transcription factor [Propionibacteriaceae bacterium]